MRNRWSRLKVVFVFLISICVVLLFLLHDLLTDSLPRTDGEIRVPVLQKTADVYRDRFGVPHIFAANDIDLFKAAGYVTAQDRLWQLDFTRRIALGRLSEILGETTLEQDKFLRLIGFGRIAEEIWPQLSPESRAVYQAYADGINAFMTTHRAKLPVEFSLLGYEPDLWRPQDSIAFARVMAWNLSFSWHIDIVLGRLVEKLGVRKAREVFPDFPKTGPFIIPAGVRPNWSSTASFLRAGQSVQALLGSNGVRLGSNAWVVSGEKTPCGKPMLANDPHLQLMAPSVWYQMHLAGENLNVTGVALPGIPGIVIGHNDKIAWGLTNGMVDDADFYVEKTAPDSSKRYWDGKAWQEFTMLEEEIQVKNQEPVMFPIRFTQNGPVISEQHPAADGSQGVISMRWTGQAVSDEMSAYLQLMRAGTWDDFVASLQDFKVPAQNFVFAGSDGDIGYYLAGAIPLRRRNGMLPQKGWSKAGRWNGFIPFEKLPHVKNPPLGYIFTANNKIVSDRYPYYISDLWEPPSRAARIQERLQAQTVFTVDDFISMQSDVESVLARSLLPVILHSVETRLDSTTDGDLAMLYRLIKDWDGVEAADRIEPSIFHALFVSLTKNTLQDEMGEALYESYIKTGNVPFRVMPALLARPESSWFDDVNSSQVESMDDIIARSLIDAGKMLRQTAGDRISDWRWGEVHQLKMMHPLGRHEALDFILNIGPFPRPGSTATLDNSEYRFAEPFASVVGPSMRQIVDLCDLQHSLSIITTGESGQRLSEHYKDQTLLWLNHEYHTLVLDKSEVVRSAAHHLKLLPE